MGKRKGEDILSAGVSTVVSSEPSPRNNPVSSSFTGTSPQYTHTTTTTTTMGKRKGGDIFSAGVSTVISAEPTTQINLSSLANTSAYSSTSLAPEWLDSASIDHKLRVVREILKLDSLVDDDGDDEEDDFIRDVHQCHFQLQAFQRQQNQFLEESKFVKDTLHFKIKEQQDRCQHEQSTVEALEANLKEIIHERDSIERDIAALNRMREELETKISIAMEEANQEVENIDLVEEARKNQVPKLKHQISMYATTTGIKWDYEDGDVLQGEVTISSKEVIRSFKIDPNEHSRFEVAQKLWEVLDASNE